MCGQGGMEGHVGGKTFARVCMQNYSGAQFIAPRQGLISNPNMYPGPAGDWEDNLGGSCGSTTLRPKLQSSRWPMSVCGKWVPRVFLPWVNSNLRVRIEPPSQACHPLRGQGGKYFSVACDIVYRVNPYFTSPNDPGAYPLARTCRYLYQHLQIWRRWWCQSGFPISLGWVCHPLSPSHPSPDVTPPLIWCVPGELGVPPYAGRGEWYNFET